MLRVTLFLVLFGLAFAADELRWDKIPVAVNASQCIYRVDAGIFSCRGAREEVVECAAVIDGPSPRRYDVFGISRLPEEAASVEQQRYYLWPREMDNATYLDRRIVVEDRTDELFLYYGERPAERVCGLRVTDVKCYPRLVELFRGSAVNHEVVIGEQRVSLFGEILIAEKPAHKRWLGWLWGWGLGGWGWGLGWGWPYYGWGWGLWGR